ncbi:hypothetical protein CBW65_12105 [Tumebacillus avium]|uniref:Uncharacterized protein n=1 Tax=Tumebacillus avium TaxID=1903704 RepID=A0A1Y0INQ0_9BACL|nr:hypothetical protein [Tumebacillus avium]ARU61679.1 hypothetical protein CBW65_12105 [Tumebacillus avium]
MIVKRDVLNKLLLLKVLELTNKVPSGLVLQKMVFDLERNLRIKKGVTFNYEFVRSLSYPYSRELQYDLDFLLSQGLVIKRGSLYSLGEKGRAAVIKAKPIYMQLGIDTSFENMIKQFNKIPFSSIYESESSTIKSKNVGEVIEPEWY